MAYFNKGMAYKTLKGEDNAKKALELFDLAIKYQKDYYNAYFNKGEVLIVLGKYFDAITCFNKCKSIKGKDDIDSIKECEHKIKECERKINTTGGVEVEIKYEEVNEENKEKEDIESKEDKESIEGKESKEDKESKEEKEDKEDKEENESEEYKYSKELTFSN